MQLRHIRPGTLEWQDAKAEEVDRGFERLTPEEITNLRKLTDRRRNAQEDGQHTQAEMR